MQLQRLAKQVQNPLGEEYRGQDGTLWVWAEAEIPHSVISSLCPPTLPSSSLLLHLFPSFSLTYRKTQLCFKAFQLINSDPHKSFRIISLT